MSGNHSRRKGANAEREVVALARAAGLDARRTWELAQSSQEKQRACDVEIAGQPYQVKRSRDGHKQLYRELEHVAGLFVRADGREWLVVLRAADYFKSLGALDASKP